VSAATRRVRLDLAYDGTAFAGWQVQPGSRTAQGVLEDALSRLQGGGAVAVRGAGRTDAGVHARGQVADAALSTELDDADLAYALRRMLPGDLRPLAVRTVGSEFNARKAALGKTYAYRVDLSPHADPFRARFALHWPFAFDRVRVEAGLARLPGRRDWSGFAASKCRVRSRVRCLTEARIAAASADEVTFVFSADGFLHHMVRNLVGTLLAIGRGQLEPEQIDRALSARDRALAGPTAPARGLCLERVVYPAAVEPSADPH
jgi:tRNA pseudouridine38-40 synthase